MDGLVGSAVLADLFPKSFSDEHGEHVLSEMVFCLPEPKTAFAVGGHILCVTRECAKHAISVGCE